MIHYSKIEVTREMLEDSDYFTDEVLFKEVAKKVIDNLSLEDLGKVFTLSKLDPKDRSFREYINDHRNPEREKELRSLLILRDTVQFIVSIDIED